MAERGMKLTISEPEERHAGPILVFDEAHNDVAEFYHSEHSTAGQSYETAYGYANRLISHDALVKALGEAIARLEDVVDDTGYQIDGDFTKPEDRLLTRLRAALALCEQHHTPTI